VLQARVVVTALVTGALLGALLLGAGGRLAMRLFALAAGRPAAFTASGTLRVVLYGAAFGLVAGALYALLRQFLGRSRLWTRAPSPLRGFSFGAAFLLLVSPGLRPPELLTHVLFAPLFLTLGILLDLLVTRRHGVPGSTAPRIASHDGHASTRLETDDAKRPA
jgi:hypothetical protein